MFAAAITAATRRKLIEAALTRPDDIIAFATDGVYSTKALDVYVPDTKTLGLWEKKVLKEGGVFALAGVNSTGKDKGKTRGFSPNKLEVSLDKFFWEIIPQLWREGKEAYNYPYVCYMTIGATVNHKKTWEIIGAWKATRRELGFNKNTTKRSPPSNLKWRKARADKLMNLPVNYIVKHSNTISDPRPPDWLDPEQEEQDDLENVVLGLSF